MDSVVASEAIDPGSTPGARTTSPEECGTSRQPLSGILLGSEGVKEWCYPEKTPVAKAKQDEILAELRPWLRKQKLRSDLGRPDPPAIV